MPEAAHPAGTIQPPTFDDVRRAARRIAPHVHRTPVFTCASLDAAVGARIFFKCENLQKAGAFKFRGACNAVLSLSPEQAARGVATHSSGNHAAALALAARLRGVDAAVVMPHDANRAKRAAVLAYGARIVDCAPTLAGREEVLARVLADTDAVRVHPYDDPRVIAGQGTAALELLAQVPDLDVVIAPVGGGGLIAGTAMAAGGLAPAVTVLGAEPSAVDDAWRSLHAGRLLAQPGAPTVADGLRATLGDLAFPILRARVQDIVRVGEDAIVRAMRLVWERTKLIVEPSAAVVVAALFEEPLRFQGRRVGAILSGGNVDLDALPWTGGARSHRALTSAMPAPRAMGADHGE
ncbi:MAG: pyridoxal-phosphate dependent enzyme [Gammaproteobacteria bacterium]|nr:pyridoxal-phosphate dependent enzyme [Gammaproteobacteria bacterium]NIR84092.1 pyridoxal-phosphate dependent enzyme [Gammaproteobacteria bacterium]NIR89236.1 pyridoxal-phosphate dependent enzyme [Gammaproteobacteria bacterium]NIU05038.1 pyridoxal-phosphate dependent enzyme [Gammaproteobacteria bacterium]NIV52204.1 pyridoxal-phosphate dependent enzyme [Gammaproteobacteria bacterium]